MKRIALSLLAVVASFGLTAFAPCTGKLEKCAQSNPGAMVGYTLVDAAYDDLDERGGKIKMTLYSGNTYRFLTCPADGMQLVVVLSDSKGKVISTNLTEDEKSVYKMMEVNVTSTAEYQLNLLPFGGKGCAGVIFAMK